MAIPWPSGRLASSTQLPLGLLLSLFFHIRLAGSSRADIPLYISFM